MSATGRIDLPKAAYIGADGECYRILVPATAIILRRYDKSLREWVFSSYRKANEHLRHLAGALAQEVSIECDFRVIFADGFAYSGSLELSPTDQAPCLSRAVQDFMIWMRDDLEQTGLGRQNAPEEAAEFLRTYDIGQKPVTAPETWAIAADYRAPAGYPAAPLKDLQARLYEAFAPLCPGGHVAVP